MKQKNMTRKALVTSILSLLLCVSMLVGTTFAWFTDSVESGVNTIAAGNLDVELEYYDGSAWKTVNGATNLFTGNLWEPGHTEVVYLKLSNLGSLALKYNLGIRILSETVGINVDNEVFKLSDNIYMGVVENAQPTYISREAAITAAKDGANGIIGEGYSKSGSMTAGQGALYLAVVVYMPESVGNEANYKTGTTRPEINLGINLFATQKDAESDSFGNDYDKTASVTVAPGESIADAIRNAEDGGVIFLENGVHNIASGPIVIEGKTVTIIGMGEVTINKNYGSTHIFTIMNGADVTIENVTMDGKDNTREGIYVRWNSVVTLKDVVIKNTGGKDIMIDEASDAAHGEETASYVWLYNSHIEDVAMCASPATTVAATQDTFVYFNYDADSTVGVIDVQGINLKPENVIINGVASTEVGTTMQLYAANDAELDAALNTIKTNEAYWNKRVIVYLAAGIYSGDHVINQYPLWNGIPDRNTGNNYQGGVPAGAPNTVITFVGETASSYSLRGAQNVPAVIFTGNVTVNGFADSMAGMNSAVAVTTFQNVAFDAANSMEANGEDYIAMYVTAAASNVNFEGCVFTNATHVNLGGSSPNGIGNVSFISCTFENGGCLSGYPQNLKVTDCVVDGADNGFINIQSGGAITVDNSVIEAGKYFIRTKSTGAKLAVTNSEITMYESDGLKHLVFFRGSDESAEFTDCTIADGYTTAGVDANSTLEIYNFSETEDGLVLVTDGVTDEVTFYLVPADYEGTTVVVPEGVDSIGNYAFTYNSNVKEVILSSTVRDLGRGFDSSSVEKVVLNEGLTTISSRAFKSTTALKEIVIPSTVTVIEDNAFQKSGMKEIMIPSNVETVGEAAFGASLIETVTFEGDIAIQGYAFRGCPALKTVIMKGYNVTFVASTLNGRNSMWFCNGESNNPNTSNITFYVKNEEIKTRVLKAMGAEGNNTTVECEQTPDENGVYTDSNGDTYVYASDDATLGFAISNGAETVYLSAGNYIVPNAAQGRTLTIVGNGNTVIATKSNGSYEGCNYALDGSTVNFKNITINTPSTTYIGYARCKATYDNCTFNGTYTLYDNSLFNNCTFNVSGDAYNISTWGAPNATFNGCTFNSDGKALLLYGTVNTKLTLNDCIFHDNGGLTDLKAAVEIGNDYGKSYQLIVNNTVVNGYEINDKGINTGTTLWANKNSMGTDKLNVVVDGVDVY